MNQYNAPDSDAEYFPETSDGFEAAVRAKAAVRAARHILLNTRIQDFTGGDVVALAGLILSESEKLRK